MAAINMPQRTESPLGGILGIVNTISNLKKNSNENDLNQQKTEAATLSNNQTKIAQKTAQDQMTALQTPGSAEGEAYKRGLLGSISLGKQAFPVKDPDAQSALNDTIQSLKDPNLTGWQAKNMSDSSPLISSLKDFGDKQIAANAMAAAAKIKSEPQIARLEETKNEHSIGAGKEFESDPIIKLSKTSLNSLTKSQSILSNPNKPVTTKDLNLAYNDYINSVAAGGSATEGKIARELPETWATDFNTLKGKAGEFDDLRNNPTGRALIDQLTKNISTVRHDMSSAISDQAANIYANYENSTNPKVQATAKQKLKSYAPDKYAQKYGGPVPQQTYTSSGEQSSEKQPPGGHTTVQQGGHTFTWNSQSGKYE